MNKSLIFLTVGSIIAIAISFLKLNEHRKREKRKKEKQEKQHQKKSKKQEIAVSATTLQTELQLKLPINDNSRQLYENEISQPKPYQLIIKTPQYNPNIDHLHYTILLNLNKSKGYEGVIKIRMSSNKNYLNQTNLYVDYIGGGILYLGVNGRKIEENKVSFDQHQICIKKEWLSKYENQVEVIFKSKYAFMGNGLTCYFPLDQANKYSLKGQVIYARNGLCRASRIIPCLSILNPCEVSLQILHPNGFNAQGNSNKILTKIATKKDYPLYSFLFEIGSNVLNTSRRLNNSSTSETSIKSTDQIIKVKSEFSLVKLGSIHDFFVFCSAVTQVRPLRTVNSSISLSLSLNLNKKKTQQQPQQILKQILIRYFTKQHLLKKATSFLNMLQSQLRQIFTKIDQYKTRHKKFNRYQGKIDIFFIDDVKSEGDFRTGAILLSEKTIQRGVVDRRLQFLLCRGVIGMGLLGRKNRCLLTLEQIVKLNELVLEVFPECCDYIFVKNIEYKNIQAECVKLLDPEKEEGKQGGHRGQGENMIELLHQYYEKQCRYFVRDMVELRKKVSGNVGAIVDNLELMDSDQCWIYFIARHPFIEVNVAEVLIKITLKLKGPPTGPAELKYAKQNFIKSKYYLSFFSLRQLQKSLKTQLQLQSPKLHKILPFIKIKQSCLTLIPPSLESYLPARQNRIDCQKLYEQFKKYNESNNFHHISALSREIKRIRLFLGADLKPEKRDIQCCLQSWKLLVKLGIYPEEEAVYGVVCWLERVKVGEDGEQQRVFVGPNDGSTQEYDRSKEQSSRSHDRKQDQDNLQSQVRQIQRLLQAQMQK